MTQAYLVTDTQVGFQTQTVMYMAELGLTRSIHTTGSGFRIYYI